MPHIVIFLLGAGAAVVLKALGLTVFRPVIKGVVKGGIRVGRQMQEFAAEVTEEFQDVSAEASSEVDAGPTRRTTKSTPPKGI
ncbi:MAG TPA: DUF5132 domain-containing protein [Thermoanaerobaculia bacterium]|nr:DUF5132 domain-containing protein [Thermoanaerobaculia bacterium]